MNIFDISRGAVGPIQINALNKEHALKNALAHTRDAFYRTNRVGNSPIVEINNIRK